MNSLLMEWDRDRFLALLRPVIDVAGAAPWDAALEARLASEFPIRGEIFDGIVEACRSGVEDGWMDLAGDDQRRGGRVVEPGPASRDFSVDVVELADFTGPHHRHPGGELCAVLPVSPGARFDGRSEGWCVYPPGSSHWPAATGGRLRVMFLLPGGRIEYTDAGASLGSGSTKGG